MLTTCVISLMLTTSSVPQQAPLFDRLDDNKVINVWTEDVVKETNVIEEAELCIEKVFTKKWSMWRNVLKNKLQQVLCSERKIQSRVLRKWYSEIKGAE